MENEAKGVEHSYKAMCVCGNVTQRSPRDFPSRLRCKKCTNTEKAHDSRLLFEDVKSSFEKNGLTLLEEEYKSGKTKMRCICTCGEIANLRYEHVSKGGKCSLCMYKRNGRRKFDEDGAELAFQKLGIVLLTKGPIKQKDLVEYTCDCGRIGESIFSNVLSGTRCRNCHIDSISGENSHFFDPTLTDDHRTRYRVDVIGNDWSNKVRKRDSYKCQICGIDRKTVAHHIFSYSDYPELRVDVGNGITLCRQCHTDFHRHYGYGRNDLDQLMTYLMWRWENGNQDSFIRY